MVKRQFLYGPVWIKYLDQIKRTLEFGLGEGFPIPPANFKKVGNRKKYGFRLEVKNRKVVNDISGSAVARDLAYLLLEDPGNKKLLAKKHFFIRMNNSFYCEIYPVKLYQGIMDGSIN
jgi:hypothetical protein